MPHVTIKTLIGKTEEQKKKAAEAVAEALKNTWGVPKMYFSVSLEEYTPQEWQEVYQKEVVDKADALYVKPSYDPKSLL